MDKKKAFTLTEALVTLMLIGFVAALTMPFLINEFNKQKWSVIFKRTFAETYNVLQTVALEEDCAKSLTCTKIFEGGQEFSTQKFGNAYTTAMATAQNCGTDLSKGCFNHEIKIGEQKKETITTSLKDGVSFEVDPYTFVTTRGVSYALLSFGLNCLNTSTIDDTAQGYLNYYVRDHDDDSNQMLSLCGFIVVDVNGKQNPNTWGKDVFGIWVTDRHVLGLYPFGGDFDNRFQSCNMQTDSRGCAARLIKDGWTITYF